MAKPTMINLTSKFDTMADKDSLFREGYRLDRVWYSAPSKVWALYDVTNPAGDRMFYIYKNGREYFNVVPNMHTGTMFFLNDEKRAKFHALPDYVAKCVIDATNLKQRQY